MTQVPFVDLTREFKAHEDDLVEIFRKIGRSGAYVMGPELAEFEELAAKYCGVKYALGVADGTDALILGLKAFGVGPGDEVITTPNSFIASVGAIVAVGATPRFVDVKNDLNMDPSCLREAITDKTKAVMPVHLTGRPSDMGEINKIAREFNLFVIEDAAQAIGGRYRGRPVGSLGDIAAFSLHPLKNLHIYGDGGLITTDNEDFYLRIKALRNHGLKDRDTCGEWGMNSRLDTLQAAIASFKLTKLDEWTKRFREIAAVYRQGLSDYLTVPVDTEDEFAVYHNFVVHSDQRKDLMEYLASRGIDTKIHYPVLLHLQPAAEQFGYREGDFPVAEKLSKTMMSLPIFPALTQIEIDSVVSGIRDFYTK